MPKSQRIHAQDMFFNIFPESASEGFPLWSSPGAREAPFHLQGRSQELHATRHSSLQAPECCKIRHASFGAALVCEDLQCPRPGRLLGARLEGRWDTVKYGIRSLGAPKKTLSTLRGTFDRPWTPLGASLGPPWGILGASLALPGTSLGPPWNRFGVLWDVLRLLWTDPWSHFGLSGRCLDRV